ncbi:MAG: AMP-binding protein, partial [Alphaproteobacteria bacterium]|nr:AMP-binding protein [Alphaproteobacteria bacterium]
LERAVRQWPNVVFLVRENITYSQFIEKVRARATTLHKLGVKPGDVVGVLSHNLPEFPLTLFAIWYLGGIALLLDTNLTPYEYDNMTSIVNCKLVCAEKSFFYKAKKFKFFDITQADGDIDLDLRAYPSEATDIATMSFTSGSTGTPKVVPLTHFNLTETANALEDMCEYYNSGEIMYGLLPLYHVFGFATGILATVRYGGGLLLQPVINPKYILDDFKTYKPHVIPAVPRIWELFRNKIIDNMRQKGLWRVASFVLKNQKTLESMGLGYFVRKIQEPLLDVFGGRVKLLIAGGAATKPEVENFYISLGLGFIQGYGLTETVGPICISKPTSKRLAYSVGGPTSNNECEIRDKDENGIGVLWLRGHQVFNGYLNAPSINAECFDEKGFFNTGDLAYLDKNGEIHFAGRKKQVIVLDSGKNVYPDELEALFMEIPGVKNVAVFEHKVKNKTVTYAVFSVDKKMTIDTLADHVAEANKKVASYKWVTHFAMTTEDLPMTSTQKVKHHVVRQNLTDGKYPDRKE